MAILQIPHHSVVDKLDGYHQNSKTLGCEQLEEYQCIDNIARHQKSNRELYKADDRQMRQICGL
jgi:hypothetical protein